MGWTEGSNLRIELRWAAVDPDKIRTFAKERVDLRPDAILGQSTSATGVLARETRTIPIVFAVVADPIGSGFVANLAHPGGNMTGFTGTDPALGGKWVELLKEIAPRTAGSHEAIFCSGRSDIRGKKAPFLSRDRLVRFI